MIRKKGVLVLEQMIKSILLHSIALHDPVYIIMAWKRHLVTRGTLVIFAQLKVIYERQKIHILRTKYHSRDEDSFVARLLNLLYPM